MTKPTELKKLEKIERGYAMPEKTSRDPGDAENGSTSIERLLQAEKAVEARLVEARETAARIVADAYGAAQSIERKTDARIATMAGECARENDRRVSGILAEVEEIGKKPVDAKYLRGAIPDAGSCVDAARRSPAVALMDGLAPSRPIHAVEILAQ